MMLLLLLTGLLLPPDPPIPADTLTLAACYRLAEAAHPLQATAALHEAISAREQALLGLRFRPDLALNGLASYQSDVPGLDLALPGATPPRVPHDQYKVALSVDQLLYDGGSTRRQQALHALQGDLARQQVAVAVYQIREQVHAAFFGVLLHQARLASLRTLAGDLQAQLDLARARIREGTATPGTADVLEVERLKVEQQILEVDAERRAALAVLGILTGTALPEETVLALPPARPLPDEATAEGRPELAEFALRRAVLAGQAALTQHRRRPQVSSFAEAAYGRPPGQDFFEDTFQPFYSAGLRMRWRFWDWHQSRREREILDAQAAIIEAQEAAFRRQVRAALVQQREAIARLEAVLERDAAIIALRQRISDEAASRLQNGVITATQYVLERNALQQARQTADLHRIQLAQARALYLTTLGER
ncbi:MAG: TolC family protein [Bacteroidetes bacterium]|nr:MAG: TolC family protein [Bacteroidota bacterium]